MNDVITLTRTTLERLGFDLTTRLDVQVTSHTYASKQEQYRAWCIESLNYAADALSRGRTIDGLRGWGQACEYRDRAGPLGHPSLYDAFGRIRNEIERQIRK